MRAVRSIKPVYLLMHNARSYVPTHSPARKSCPRRTVLLHARCLALRSPESWREPGMVHSSPDFYD